ncbi:MAG: xanthine dehydrogenase accessory factor, partial [Thermoleophilaceae bacterium]|nr:xanthine dehydrogenase accessory factor [Thermoleophilaceae bacterium]
MSLQSEFAAAERAALVTVVAGAPHARLLVRPDQSVEGTLGDPELDAAAVALAEELMWAERSERREVGDVSLFIDVTAPPPRLIMFGAVDFAAALSRMARAAG